MYNPLVEMQKICDNIGRPDVRAQPGQVPTAHIQHVEMQSVQTRLERITSSQRETASEQALDKEIEVVKIGRAHV